MSLRADESLYFVNVRFLEDLIQNRLTESCMIDGFILVFAAVNALDFSAFESLEALTARITGLGVGLHLSEGNGAVMARLKRSHLIDQRNGWIFFPPNDAW